MTKPYIEKTNMTGEWELDKYYVKGDEFTYKSLKFHVTEEHRSCEEFHPRNEINSQAHGKESGMPFKQIKEAKDVTSFEAK